MQFTTINYKQTSTYKSKYIDYYFYNVDDELPTVASCDNITCPITLLVVFIIQCYVTAYVFAEPKVSL